MTALEVLAALLNAAVLLVVSIVIASLAARYHQSQEHLETHRKHLSDVQAFRDLIFESVGSGLVAVDTAARVTAFNRAAESITGVRAADALGQRWSAIFGQGIDLDQVSRAIDSPGELPPRHEFQLSRRDGSRVPVGITFWALRSGGGDAVGLIGVCQDLSLIKQMEERMRQADRLAAVGRLAANMAHEIRNPLASISGAVQMLVKDLPADDVRGRLVEIVLKESGRLNDLVGDFLEYARPAPMAPIAVDMAQLIDEVLLLIEHRSLPPNLKIIREYGESLICPRRSPADAPGDLEPLLERGAGHAGRRRRDPRRLAPSRPGIRRRLQLWIARHRLRDRRPGLASHLRALLLDEGRGKRSRPGPGLPCHAGPRRADRHEHPPGRRHHVHPDLARCSRGGAVRAHHSHREATMSAARVLIVDDERSMRDLLAMTLEKAGHDVTAADGGEAAIEAIRKESFDGIITDLRMPKVDGMQVLRAARDLSPETAVIVVTAVASTETAVEAMKLGAYDYITKPFKLDEVNLILKNGLERKRLRDENLYLRRQLETQHRFENIIGKSARIVEVFDTIRKIADSPATAMITGESGTGKELVARAIHFNSQRRDKPFVSVNCGAIPEGLMESELFGHVKGSFTGAVANKVGLFTAAEGGTLFLDEITEIPPLLQVKLVRAIQMREVRRVGDTKDIKTDVRLIAASNRDLETAVREGVMREDLFYRLNVIPIDLPPLRERHEDIPLLVAHFIQRFSKELGKDVRGVTPEAMAVLERHHWPGNIRELENAIERAIVLGSGDMLGVDALPESVRRERPAREPELAGRARRGPRPRRDPGRSRAALPADRPRADAGRSDEGGRTAPDDVSSVPLQGAEAQPGAPGGHGGVMTLLGAASYKSRHRAALLAARERQRSCRLCPDAS